VNKAIAMHLDALSNVKGLSKEVVFSVAEEGIKEALVAIVRRKTGTELPLEVSIDRETGDYAVAQVKKIVEDDDFVSADTEIALSEARKRNPECEVGGEIREQFDYSEFGRMISRHAKQAIAKKMREAEMMQTAKTFQQRIGELFTINVQRVSRDEVTGDIGNNTVEGVFLREEMLPREAVRSGDRLRGYLYEVKSDVRGTRLYLTRTRAEMLMQLFRLEVPEIAEQLIDIKSAARDPGVRAKIAVKTNDGRIDPIGACVGMRGSRVQAVSGELGGERVDIILWNDDPAQLVINAMAPAEVSSIVVDEDSHSIDIAVEEDQLALAIGKNGQNVRLASQLTGWNINIMTKEEASQKHQAETQKVVEVLMQELDVDEDLAKTLVDQGFTNVEEVAYVPREELLAIEGFDEEIVEVLRERAKDILLKKTATSEEAHSGQQPAEDLLALKGMTPELARELAANGVVTREDLAEQGVADLLDITKKINAAKAAELIMTARAHWFSEEDGEKM